MPPEKPQWAELFTEVVTSGLCTGCSACVIACPYDVLGYDDADGVYRPFHVDAEGGPDNCTHGLKGCTLCTRACPRFRTWEPEIENHLFGRERTDEEVSGISRRTVLARATDADVAGVGQDGGFVSALLIWAFEHDVIDAALVSALEGDGSTWKAVPAVARSREDVLATAGSRYTYSANPMAYAEAIEGGAERIALVGMGCQASAPGAMQARKAGKIARRFALTIGLLCSKTFDDAIFPELFEEKYGLARAEIVKMNIKGVFQVWMRDGGYHEIPLKEAHAWTREGCKACPDFAAEHADISTGGIGAFGDWTLTLLRTEKGEALFNDMEAAGVVEVRPIEDDPGAVDLAEPPEPGQSQALAGHGGAHAGAVAGTGELSAAVPSRGDVMAGDGAGSGGGPKKDEFAAYLGIEVDRRGPGHTVALLQTAVQHANPHGTVHGAVFYAVAGAAVAAAANDAEHSGIITSVLVEYLQPAAIGDELYAEVARQASTEREDIFTGTVRRGAQGDLLAWVRARGTRRARS